jgi:hypothetical protein
METATMTFTETYDVVRGDRLLAANSGALVNEYVVRVLVNGTFSKFLTRKNGSKRYFTTASSARKAITREKRGDYHR